MAFVKIAPLPERKARIALLKSGANPKKCPIDGETYTGSYAEHCKKEHPEMKTSGSKKAMEDRKSQETELGKSYGGKD